MEWVDTIKFDSNGLVPALIQDYQNGDFVEFENMDEAIKHLNEYADAKNKTK